MDKKRVMASSLLPFGFALLPRTKYMGRGVMRLPVKTPLIIKRNLKTTPPRSDPRQKGYLCIPKTRF